jgi:hypothetical protein
MKVINEKYPEMKGEIMISLDELECRNLLLDLKSRSNSQRKSTADFERLLEAFIKRCLETIDKI